MRVSHTAPLTARAARGPLRSLPVRAPPASRVLSLVPIAHPATHMEYSSKSYLWVAAAALLAASGGCGAVGVRRAPTGTVLDIIDTDQVERILAERARGASNSPLPHLQRNELDEDAAPADPTVVATPEDAEPPPFDFRKMLKSSRNALLVTRKEYLKEDWCKTERLVQKVREPGCLTATVVNKFCYGQCNSFYIPRGPRRRDSDERPPAAFKSCSFCRPKKVTWVTVTLRCPGQSPPYRRKRLQKVSQCKCLPAGVN
ncbi:Gremlin-2 [Eumeta japonica]|uniref:Gremlin-2 n=1 Tax=Eumeta variegata TaxID=151549 RepID=A0A4C1W262_EUMVA|nr:Gremlin-2 [Eumeta japonica]